MYKAKMIILKKAQPDRIIAAIVNTRNRIIIAVRKHIVPQQALAGAAVGVCVEEAADGGVIVAGLQVIEARFGIAIVTPVAKGVLGSDGGVVALGGRDGENIAPGVVGIFRHGCIRAVEQFDHVALAVDHVVVGIVGDLGRVFIPPSIAKIVSWAIIN